MYDITVHSVIRNEPFIYYAIKAVYDDSDVILLYDTGSDDKYTLKDIERLLDEDVDKKIIFKKVPIEVDQTVWSFKRLEEDQKLWKGKFGVGEVRQMQIDDTKTDFFLVVDGDEIYYDGTVKIVKEDLLPSVAENICVLFLPRIWYCEIDTIFGRRAPAGRVFRTDKIYMDTIFPGEIHYVKDQPRVHNNKNSRTFGRIAAIAHFEAYLKPWRRTPEQIIRKRPPNRTLPQVMIKDPYYIERFESERCVTK